MDVWQSVIQGKYEYAGYDGWYNNRAHPDWGAAGMYIIIHVGLYLYMQ